MAISVGNQIRCIKMEKNSDTAGKSFKKERVSYPQEASYFDCGASSLLVEEGLFVYVGHS